MSAQLIEEELFEATDHLVQLQTMVEEADDKQTADFINDLTAAEIARLLSAFPPKERVALWALITPENRGHVLVASSDNIREQLLSQMGAKAVLRICRTLSSSDMVWILSVVNDTIAEAVTLALDNEQREQVQSVLAYDEDQVGRYMNLDTVTIRADVRLEVIQRYLRISGGLKHGNHDLMVVDIDGVLVGTLNVIDLLNGEQSAQVSEYMNEPQSIFDTASVDELMVYSRAAHLNFVPVVDGEGVLLGQINAEDINELSIERAEATMMNMAGIGENSELFSGIRSGVQNRSTWLGINLITAFLATWVIGQFEEVLAQVVALAILMPVVASMGGIAGSQTLAITVRGLAMGQIVGSNRSWLLNKELWIGLINGLVWALVVALLAHLWFENSAISTVIGAAIWINMAIASIAGVIIPMVLHRMGQDPALSGAVILTTVSDVVGFMSFLGLATVFILQ
ncbi:magnesium transporter [Thiomicrorhabdus sediminis]|uniref:Magnesium transporter n=1 Tax=Thiomicrorhabdus sediminis TaxID=2580412 RepID=A0A4P9K587_9GAMM|nr:magnesium transporter [Thiomicrorhabdus sediminis]QCU89941.1 magnesium transporter [Thiomicrorhabdus sediminis]